MVGGDDRELKQEIESLLNNCSVLGDWILCPPPAPTKMHGRWYRRLTMLDNSLSVVWLQESSCWSWPIHLGSRAQRLLQRRCKPCETEDRRALAQDSVEFFCPDLDL